MKEQRNLLLQMTILFLFVFVIFGVIVVNEKLSPLKIPKVEEKLDIYIQDNYIDLLNYFNIGKVTYKKLKYERKISSKENEHLYFYIYYENKKVTDTYKKDYIEGNSILNYQKEVIKKNIKIKTKKIYSVSINNTLNKYTPTIQNQIINTKSPESLKIYNLKAEINVENLSTKNISNTINLFISNIESKNITPKSYTFIISNEENTNAIKIDNITTELIENNELDIVISDIINKKKSSLLDTYNISYEYLN